MNEMIGVLALQGAYQKQVEMLARMGVEARLVRTPDELDACSGLIIPGGESTTMSLLVQKFALYDRLRAFAANRPVMGVCAGAILVAQTVDDARVTPLAIMPISIRRNHYGRQVHSFTAAVGLRFDVGGTDFPAHFIRAPSMRIDNGRGEVLAVFNDEAVMIRHGQHLAVTFHPELTSDQRVHEYWLSLFHPQFKREAA